MKRTGFLDDDGAVQNCLGEGGRGEGGGGRGAVWPIRAGTFFMVLPMKVSGTLNERLTK